MKPITAIPKIGVLLIGLLAFTGCATPALWAKKNHRPAENPNLTLACSADGTDVLVCYDELCGTSTKVYRKAYWLFAYDAQTKHRKPHFTKPETFDRLTPIPVRDISQTNSVPASGYAGFIEGDSSRFRLWRDGQPLGGYNLPIYNGAPPASFWRVGLTPLAVATDVAIVCVASSGYAPH